MSYDVSFDRRSSIGASEAARVLDIDEHARAFDAWVGKRSGIIAADESSPYARAGNLLEADVVAAYADSSRIELVDPAQTFRHRLFRCLSATPDRMSTDRSVGVEAKVVFSEKSWAEWSDDSCPLKYEIQCRHSLSVCDDVDTWVLIACRGTLNATEENPDGTPTIDPATLQVRLIHRNQLKEDFLTYSQLSWWIKHVVNGEAVEKQRRASGYARTFRDRFDSLDVSSVSPIKEQALRLFWQAGDGV